MDSPFCAEIQEVAFSRFEALAAGVEREANVEFRGEGPVTDLFGVAATDEDLPSSCSKLEDRRGGDADDGLIALFSRGGDEAEVEADAGGLGRTPSGDE